MNVHTIVPLAAVVLQAASAGVMFFIARAPGWARVRLMASIALTAGVYSAIDVWFSVDPTDLALRGALVQLNLLVAACHALTWVWFTFSDASGTWRSIPRWAKLTALTPIVVGLPIVLAGLALDRSRVTQLQVAWLRIDQQVNPLAPAGELVAALVLVVFGVCLVHHLRRLRRGEPGALGIVVGFVLFGLCVIEEALVASGALQFMYLASPGYVFIVLPLTIQLLQRFSNDARQLAALSERLSIEVDQRTLERDAARDALAAQQRLAALGRLAAGVGHEINNPLQYLMYNLEVLEQELGPSASDETREALEQCVDGTRRIRSVVAGLRTYAQVGHTHSRVNVHEAVHAALRIAGPHLRGKVAVTTRLHPVPDVLGDEGKLVQILVNPIVNAAQAMTERNPAGAATLLVETTVTADGAVDIAMTDSGPGFDPGIVAQLGEPYVTTRRNTGGSGLGLFLTHGLVAEHKGLMLVENRPGGGATVHIRLPAVGTDIDDLRAALARTAAPDGQDQRMRTEA